MVNDILNELHVNFLEYAAAVNSDRAIPDARDGLKPVAKRILWAATDMTKCSSSKPHVKSARLVGDVMGSYHPHGDSSIYGALVRLSQNWVMRYPLIDFHGNNGNVIGDGPAHMRYTEVRLSKLTEDGLLNGIKKESVDFIPNYDETTVEPVTLPSAFPNLLCNPNTGIGVAMACSFAPHNLNEVAQAIYDYMDGKEPMLPGPDFPTGGIIINKNDIPMIMKTGHGSVKIRSKYTIEKQKIVFTEIPYGTTVESLLIEIGAACDNKEIEGISDIRDESNKKGVRIVLDCEKGINPEAVVDKLFAKTSLQSSFSYNQVALVDKTPTELNLKDCIKIYIDHNIDCIKREGQFDLAKAQNRLEIVDGLLKALEDIDNIITLIKKSESGAAAKDALIAKYNFTDNQAKAILAMRLSSLAKLENVELNNEKTELINKTTELKDLIQNKSHQREEVKNRLSEIVKKYGDARQTELIQIDATTDTEIKVVKPEDVVVTVTKSGNIKCVPKTSFKTQKRNGVGVKTLDEAILSTISTNTTDTLMFFTNKGRMYQLSVDKVPEKNNTAKGDYIGSLVKLNNGEVISTVASANKDDNLYVIFITKNGLIKKTPITEYYSNSKRTTGVQAIKLKEDDEITGVFFTDAPNNDDFIIVTKKGMSIHIKLEDIPIGSKISMGVKGIKLKDDDFVVGGAAIKDSDDYLACFTESGMGKQVAIKELTPQGRGGVGIVLSKESLAGVCTINTDDKVLVIGRTNSICVNAKDIPVLTRTSIGNQMIKNNAIIKIVKL